jgi:uncharacterized LabA/DUF88 family protein
MTTPSQNVSTKERIIFLVDGFNLYHALESMSSTRPVFKSYKWLDLKALCNKFTTSNQIIEGIFYFTALAPWSPTKRMRHEIYISALESTGVRPVYGDFRRVTKRCPRCGDYETYEEKKTDVNIAIHLFKLASKNKYDKLVLVTGDSDIIPSIAAVRDMYPAKKIGVAIPIGRRAEDLKNNCDFSFKIKEKHLATSILPDSITLQNGRIVTRPVEWT